ncbi:monovalent cation/H+ antiporter complex subunit F [Schaedlerella sp.]|uniref:monovalent cation/H+ antiporter complex subunit F n=1 Tax=Schaedlerella sp. TaxID=2676057 RepID=UPI0037460EB6
MRIILEHSWIFISIFLFLAILLLLCLIRAIKGPTIADRVVAVNMMGTIVMVVIAMLAVYMGEGYLLDICLIYAMISFLAVVVLTKVYSGVHLEKLAKHRKLKQGEKAGQTENTRESESGRKQAENIPESESGRGQTVQIQEGEYEGNPAENIQEETTKTQGTLAKMNRTGEAEKASGEKQQIAGSITPERSVWL